MDKHDRCKPSRILLSRRSAMIMAGAAGLIVAKPVLGALVATPAQTSGPFYPVTIPQDSDADLTWVKGHSKRASGLVIDVVGRVFDARGFPLAGAWIEIWQADTFGIYRHPGDTNNAKADPGFQGYAVVQTAKDGGYRFRTIKPKFYKAGSIFRTPHIHFRIIEGSTSRLITQMYFPNEKHNQNDVLFGKLANPADKTAATARIIKTGPPVQYRYDIVL